MTVSSSTPLILVANPVKSCFNMYCFEKQSFLAPTVAQEMQNAKCKCMSVYLWLSKAYQSIHIWIILLFYFHFKNVPLEIFNFPTIPFKIEFLNWFSNCSASDLLLRITYPKTKDPLTLIFKFKYLIDNVSVFTLFEGFPQFEWSSLSLGQSLSSSSW